MSQVGSQHRLEFTPTEIGPHTVDIKYSGQPVHGSPYIANIYDVSRVQISDAPSTGVVGNAVNFTGWYIFVCKTKQSPLPSQKECRGAPFCNYLTKLLVNFDEYFGVVGRARGTIA